MPWRLPAAALAIAASAVSLVLMAGFFGPTKTVPIALDLLVLYLATVSWTVVATR